MVLADMVMNGSLFDGEHPKGVLAYRFYTADRDVVFVWNRN